VGGRSEGLTQALAQVAERLQGEGENIQIQFRRIQQSLQPYEKNDAAVQQWQDRIRTIDLEVRELAREIDRFAARSSYDPQQLATWQERLSEGFRLLKKHGLKQTQELIDLQQRLGEKLRAVQSMHEQVDALRSHTRAQEQDVRQRAQSLRATRQRTIGPWTEQVNKLLQQVGMPTARFGVQLVETDLRAHGADECLFVMDANYRSGQGTPHWQPVRKVASGGELSRLMLCIKSLAADRMQMHTLVFDEIDAGISGEAAKQVGHLLRALGNNRQVICVTHQPQVAAKGKQHWHVTKSETAAGIETHVECLSAKQRVDILARIIGGESPTETARRNAEELLAT